MQRAESSQLAGTSRRETGASIQGDMIKPIHEAGRTPVPRNTFYEPVKVLENTRTPETAENPARSTILESNLATA